MLLQPQSPVPLKFALATAPATGSWHQARHQGSNRHQVCYTETQRIEESYQFSIIGVSGLNLSFATTPNLTSRIFSDNVTIRATQKHRQGPLITKTSSSGS
ncbi:hypothetical protein LB504_003346 [Fusarium proliferatum]|nr:hypothetical protein LB504_003346 [Fusarium proliferatum]